MKLCRLRALALTLPLLPLFAAAPLEAQKTAAEAEPMPDFDAYAPYRTHRPEHDVYDALVGSWECSMTAWLHGDPPPQGTIAARFDARWVFGGRFLEAQVHRQGVSEHFAAVPLDIHGVYYFGWNTYEKRYYNVLLHEEDVIPLLSDGSWNAAEKTLTFSSEEDDPVSGDSFRKWEVFHLLGGDELGYELYYGFVDGTEIKAAECTYRRKK